MFQSPEPPISIWLLDHHIHQHCYIGPSLCGCWNIIHIILFRDTYISIKINIFSGVVRLFLWKWYIFVFDNWIYNLIMCSWEKINLLSSEEGSLQLWWKYHNSKNNILLDIITLYYCTVLSFVSVPPAPKFECSQNHKVNSSNLPTQKSFL